jgi:hypothetical protein
MPAKATKKFMTVEAVGGRVAINVDLIERVAFVSPMVPGLPDEETERLRLSFSGAYHDVVDIEDREESERVLKVLKIEDLAEQEVAV